MKDPNKSHYEREAESFLKKEQIGEMFIQKSFYDRLGFFTDKLLGVCEELRTSRENWKKKYMDIKNGINSTNKGT